MAWTEQGKKVVLVRKETVPDDIHGMYVSQGVLTATGGMTSHAAVVGRQMGKPADRRRLGAAGWTRRRRSSTSTASSINEGDYIAFDGLSGEVKVAKVATKPSEILQVIDGSMKPEESDIYQRFAKLLQWADKIRTMGIRANADLPDQAEIAYAFGAQGIGLCRTEHMFFAEDRLPIVRRMILADNEADRKAAAQRAAADAARRLLRRVQGDARLPGDGPDDRPAAPRVPAEARGPDGGRSPGSRRPAATRRRLEEKKTLLARVEQLHEFNPMLGHRGCRLGITYPEITEMQTRAIMEAACQLNKEGLKVVPEIMIPLVGFVKEFARPEGDRQARGQRGHEGAGDQDQVPRRHDDRGAARGGDRRRDRRRGRSSSRSGRTT